MEGPPFSFSPSPLTVYIVTDTECRHPPALTKGITRARLLSAEDPPWYKGVDLRVCRTQVVIR